MPVLEHEVSQITKRTDADPYGCHNGERNNWYWVKDGLSFRHTGMVDGTKIAAYKMRMVDDVMSADCRYDMSLTDKRCSGCKHAGSGEAYDQMIRSKGK